MLLWCWVPVAGGLGQDRREKRGWGGEGERQALEGGGGGGDKGKWCYLLHGPSLLCWCLVDMVKVETGRKRSKKGGERVIVFWLLNFLTACWCISGGGGEGTERGKRELLLFVGCLTSQQHASVYHGWRERKREREGVLWDKSYDCLLLYTPTTC